LHQRTVRHAVGAALAFTKWPCRLAVDERLTVGELRLTQTARDGVGVFVAGLAGREALANPDTLIEGPILLVLALTSAGDLFTVPLAQA
jgi:hypothetical protein